MRPHHRLVQFGPHSTTQAGFQLAGFARMTQESIGLEGTRVHLLNVCFCVNACALECEGALALVWPCI